jgi:hypothetical protein
VPDSTRLEDTLVRGYRQLALETPARPRDVILRALDVLLSSLFLLVSLPISLVIAAAVLVTSGTPILYRASASGAARASSRCTSSARCGAARRGGWARTSARSSSSRTQAEFTPIGQVAEGDAARRDPAVRERPARRHEHGGAAADPARLLRRARPRAAVVLAAARRAAGPDRARAGAAGLRDVDGREARARSRVDRRPVGALYLRTVLATGWRVLKQSVGGLTGRRA